MNTAIKTYPSFDRKGRPIRVTVPPREEDAATMCDCLNGPVEADGLCGPCRAACEPITAEDAHR